LDLPRYKREQLPENILNLMGSQGENSFENSSGFQALIADLGLKWSQKGRVISDPAFHFFHFAFGLVYLS
jgi:hypothetical protein